MRLVAAPGGNPAGLPPRCQRLRRCLPPPLPPLPAAAARPLRPLLGARLLGRGCIAAMAADANGGTDSVATGKLAAGTTGVPLPLLPPPPQPNLRQQQQPPEQAQEPQRQHLRAPQQSQPQQRQRQREQARQLASQAAAVRQDLAELTGAYRPFPRRPQQQRQQGGERGREVAAAGYPGPAFVSVDQGDMDAAIEHTFPPTSRKAAAAAALAAAADRALAGTAGAAARRQPWPPGPAHVANVLVVSAALMNQRNEVLLSKRVRGSIRFRGMYEFPGGKVEPGEIPQYALQRELHEEIGVEVEERKLQALTFVSHRYRHFSHNFLALLFVAEEWRHEPRAMEGQELEWVHCDRLMSFCHKVPEPTKRMLAAVYGVMLHRQRQQQAAKGAAASVSSGSSRSSSKGAARPQQQKKKERLPGGVARQQRGSSRGRPQLEQAARLAQTEDAGTLQHRSLQQQPELQEQQQQQAQQLEGERAQAPVAAVKLTRSARQRLRRQRLAAQRLLQDSETAAQEKPEQREGEQAQQGTQLSDGEEAQPVEVAGMESRSARRRRLRAAAAKRLQQALELAQGQDGLQQQPRQQQQQQQQAPPGGEGEVAIQAIVEVEEQAASTRRQRRRRRVAAAKKAAAVEAAEAALAGHSIPTAGAAEAVSPGTAAAPAADAKLAGGAQLAVAAAAGDAEPGQEQERRHRSPSSVRASQIFFERVLVQRKERQAAKLARGQQQGQQGSDDAEAREATASKMLQGWEQQQLSPVAHSAAQHVDSQDSAPVAVVVAAGVPAGKANAASTAAGAADNSSDAALLAPQKKRRRKRTSLEWFELRERRKERYATQQAEQAQQEPGQAPASE